LQLTDEMHAMSPPVGYQTKLSDPFSQQPSARAVRRVDNDQQLPRDMGRIASIAAGSRPNYDDAQLQRLC
jgi:hypothetical protein